ncbi:MAG TPA: hypothetical protein GXX19_13475 [Syntrophomonadaceae bacterium]|nr:hypothetical protein [Syntrophomonadaceae bacterium]
MSRAVFIFSIVYLLLRTVGYNKTPTTESPLDILKKRYARGEIDAEEFARIKKDLE